MIHQLGHQSRIAGTGMCVPDQIVTNADLEKLMNTSDEWIVQRSGISKRRYVADGQNPSDLAVEAAKNALNMAGLNPGDIDMLLVATLTPEHYFPGTAAFVQRKLGMGTAPAMDLRAQCSGFIYGLGVANAMVASGQCGRVMLIGVEVHSRGLDFTDRGRDVAVLFGDGAGAVILERSKSPEHGIMKVMMRSEGEHAERLWVQYPTMTKSVADSQQSIADGGLYPQMDGRFVFKNAVRRIPEVVGDCLRSLHLETRDIDLFLFHQANLRINEAVGQSLGIPQEKCPYNIDRYGNCSAASIPMLLDECVRGGRVKRGDLICLAGFGSGFTWGSTVIRWG